MTGTADAQEGLNNITKPAKPSRPASRYRLRLGFEGGSDEALLFPDGRVPADFGTLVATTFFRYIVERIRAPGRPNKRFTGRVGDIWWAFVLLGLCSYGSSVDYISLLLLIVVMQAF